MGYALKIIVLFWLLFISVDSLAQSPLDQPISIKIENERISECLFQLSEIAQVSIVFNSRILKEDQQIDLEAEEESLRKILKRCLQGTGLDFKAEGQRIILFRQAAQKYTLSGYIQDRTTGERLVAATIQELGKGRGTTTNAYGFFSLQLSEGAHQLQISYLGYQTSQQKLQLTAAQQLTIELEPSLTLPEIIITDQDEDAYHRQFLGGKAVEVLPDDLYQNPALAGEADLFRQLEAQPGVQSGADGIGGLHIRGGETDQNLVLLDGVAVYNPSHTLGLFSVFNPHTIKNARLYKDGFSASYSGRLSSVIDVRTREGSIRKFGFEGEVSTLASKLVIEGPIKKEQSGFLLSLRRTHLDPFIRAATKKKKENDYLEGEANYHFFDVNAKFHTRVTDDDRVYLSFYKGGDDFQDESGFEDLYEDPLGGAEDIIVSNNWNQIIDWGNTIASLRWNHLYNDKLFSNTTLTYSQFKYQSKNGDDYYEFVGDELDYQENYFTSFQSIIEDFGLRMDFEYYHSPQHKILFGAGLVRRSFEPGLIEVIDDSFDPEYGFNDIADLIESVDFPGLYKTTEYTAYLEDQIQFSPRFNLHLGLATAFFQTNDKQYFSPQPRLRLRWQAPKIWSAQLSLNRMTQFLHVLTSSGSGFPSDLWVPSTDEVGPQQAWMSGLAIAADLPTGYTFQIEAYYKRLRHLIRYAEDAALPTLFESSGAFWEEEITSGKGRSYGLELQLRKTKGATTGMLGYTYSRSYRTFEYINEGQEFPFRFTHPHAFHLQLNQQFSNHISLSASWQYGSGLPLTLVSSDYRFAPLNNLSPAPTESLTSTNGYTLPAYHRLDLSLQFQWTKQKIQHFLNIGAFNLYNKKNPFYLYQVNNPDFPEDNGLKQQNALPFLPSLSYRVKI